jgi:putative transposase
MSDSSNSNRPRSAGNLPAVAGAPRSREQTEQDVKAAFQGVAPTRFSSISIRHRGRLPHWNKECGLYFVTFRTVDSLPKKRLEELAVELRRSKGSDRIRSKQFEELLDRGAGNCPMKDARCAEIVADTLRIFDGKKYRLLAWCVMPNHVHFIARLLPGASLSQVLHSLKSFTAKRINEALKSTGSVWQREYYDRLIRDADELTHAFSYVVRNPEKAGLLNWRWVENRAQVAPETAGGAPALP